MKKLILVLLTAVALALSLPALAAQGQSQGKSKAGEKAKGSEGADKGKEKQKSKAEQDREREQEQEHERQAAQGRAFGKEHEHKIREFFSNHHNLEGLPPGLAKREELPPGLQRHLERDGVLPPGLQKRLEPLPRALEVQLPATPTGIKRGVVNGNVVVIEERTSRILDIIHDVIGGGSERGETGVRRVD